MSAPEARGLRCSARESVYPHARVVRRVPVGGVGGLLPGRAGARGWRMSCRSLRGRWLWWAWLACWACVGVASCR